MSNYELKIVKFPDRKCKQLCVYDKENNIHYSVAYFLNEGRLELFLKAVNGDEEELEDEKRKNI